MDSIGGLEEILGFRSNMINVVITMPENLISDTCRGSSVTRKTRVTILASVIRAH